MRKVAGNTRVALMGVLFAMVGFSYAVATSYSGGASGGNDAGGRGVGTSIPLDFTNPFVSGPGSDRDLGDAAVNSSIAARWVRAKGGVPPYEFTSTGTPTLASVIATNATLNLALNGKLAGSLGSTAISASPLRFRVHVKDSAGSNGNSDNEIFRITLDNSGLFKFAVSALSEAVQLRPYIDVLPVINGNGPFTFTASGVKQGGTAVASLEAVGLSISSADGTVYGKVLKSGQITFTANCTDSKGNKALNRAGTAFGQDITIDVLANTIVTSDVVTTQMTIKLNTKKSDSDGISYKGLVNLKTNSVSSFSGDSLEIRVGGFVSPSVNFDGKGGAATDKGIKTNVFKSKLSTKGALSAAFSKGNVQSKLGAVTGSTVRLAVFVKIGDVIASSEILEFLVKSGGSGTTLTYKLGNGALGGNFLITAVKGKDDKAGGATSFGVTVLANPATGVQGTGTADSTFVGAAKAAVSIGNFSNTINVAEAKNKVKAAEKRSTKDPVVAKIGLDGLKGKGTVATGPLPTTQTNIRTAAQVGDGNSTNFAMNITLSNANNTVIYAGEGATTIFGKKTSFTSQNPVK